MGNLFNHSRLKCTVCVKPLYNFNLDTQFWVQTWYKLPNKKEFCNFACGIKCTAAKNFAIGNASTYMQHMYYLKQLFFRDAFSCEIPWKTLFFRNRNSNQSSTWQSGLWKEYKAFFTEDVNVEYAPCKWKNLIHTFIS